MKGVDPFKGVSILGRCPNFLQGRSRSFSSASTAARGSSTRRAHLCTHIVPVWWGQEVVWQPVWSLHTAFGAKMRSPPYVVDPRVNVGDTCGRVWVLLRTRSPMILRIQGLLNWPVWGWWRKPKMNNPEEYWVLVKEINLSYHNGNL